MHIETVIYKAPTRMEYYSAAELHRLNLRYSTGDLAGPILQEVNDLIDHYNLIITHITLPEAGDICIPLDQDGKRLHNEGMVMDVNADTYCEVIRGEFLALVKSHPFIHNIMTSNIMTFSTQRQTYFLDCKDMKMAGYSFRSIDMKAPGNATIRLFIPVKVWTHPTGARQSTNPRS